MVQDMRHRGMMFVVIPKDLCEKSGVTKIVGSAQSGTKRFFVRADGKGPWD